jgi:hypothetical protein
MINRQNKVRVGDRSYVPHGSFVQGLWNTKGAALALMALFMMMLPACATNQLDASNPQAKENVTAEEVADQTNKLLGKTVTIRSQLVKTIGTNAFKISDKKFFNGEEILVVNASGKPLPVLPNPNTEIQVTGEVRKFKVADVEREFGFDLQPDLYREYEDRPAIVAKSLALAPSPGEITKNPSLFYGKNIAVEAEVEKIVSPISFTLDEDKLTSTKDLLVLNRTPGQTIKDGERVVVTGVLRPFVVADIERDYDLNWDLTLQRKLEAEYREKPVLVADRVYPSAQED